MTVQRASIERKSSALHTDFAREFVSRRFGERDAALIYSLLPAYSRGPRKGCTKGYVHWDKVTVGGWSRDSGGRGHVERPGTRNVRICASNDPESLSIPAMRRYENETDEQRETFIREVLADMFGRKSALYGVIPAVLPDAATTSKAA